MTLTLGTLSCTGKTDPKGNASCNVTVSQGAGTYPVTTTFAGDAGYAGSNASSTYTVGAPALDCKKSKCESLLADSNVSGKTLSLVYMDDSAIKSATVVANGQSLPVTISSTSGQPASYVDANGGLQVEQEPVPAPRSRCPPPARTRSWSPPMTATATSMQWSWTVTVHMLTRLPERLVCTGCGVRRARGDEKQVG